MKYIITLLSIMFSLSAQEADTIKAGSCNPPCPPGYYCNEDKTDCVPNPSNKMAKLYRSRNTIHCPEGKIEIMGRCYTKKDLINTGFSQFMYSTINYGIGTIYSSVAGINIAQFTQNKYNHDDDYYYYHDDEAIASLAPQSSVFLVFGGIQQGAKSKQIRTLKNLGVKPAKGLVIGGMILYGASLGTYTLYLTSYAKRDFDFEQTGSIISATTLMASFAVNTAGYLVQRKMISKALNKKPSLSLKENEKGITILPYIGFSKNSGSAGLSFFL